MQLVVQVDKNRAKRIRYAFDLHARQNCRIDLIGERLPREGVRYADAQPAWPRSKIGKILRDRAKPTRLAGRTRVHVVEILHPLARKGEARHVLNN